MEHAYQHGVKCHRDIKPSNVLITLDGEVKITDFGLAKAGDYASAGVGVGQSGKEVIRSLMVSGRGGGGCGTPEYMPPEQFEVSHEADERNDIYSFGVMLYELVGGRLPFRATPPRDRGRKEMERYWVEMHTLHAYEPLRRIETPLWPVSRNV